MILFIGQSLSYLGKESGGVLLYCSREELAWRDMRQDHVRLVTRIAHLVAPERLHGRCASLHHRCTDGNVLFCGLLHIHYIYIILLNLNKRENRRKNEKKLALVYKFCHCT